MVADSIEGNDPGDEQPEEKPKFSELQANGAFYLACNECGQVIMPGTTAEHRCKLKK